MNEMGRAVVQNRAPAMRRWEMWGKCWDMEKREREKAWIWSEPTKALKREERKSLSLF